MGQCCAHHDQKELEVHKTMNLISQNKDSHESFDCDVLMSENDDMEAKLLHEPDPKYASKINVIPEKLSTKIELLLREIDRFEYDADNDMVEKAIFLGARRLINNSIYVGQWFERLRNGRGQQIMPDGSIYEGYWVNNKRQGKGRQIDYSGDYYLENGTMTARKAKGNSFSGVAPFMKATGSTINRMAKELNLGLLAKSSKGCTKTAANTESGSSETSMGPSMRETSLWTKLKEKVS